MLTHQETNYLGKEPDHAQLTTIIGMMGAGKSKLGYIVSKSLNVNFYDIDDLIEKELNTSIKELFKSHGEAYFRSVEEAKIEIVIKNAVSKNENLYKIQNNDQLTLDLKNALFLIKDFNSTEREPIKIETDNNGLGRSLFELFRNNVSSVNSGASIFNK